MARVQTDTGLIFQGADLTRDRWAVEREKLARKFPAFQFYATAGRISSVQGYLAPNEGSWQSVRVDVSSNYPYEMPKIWLPGQILHGPHRYSDGSLCVMKPEQWSSVYSLAFMVTRTAVWLNKHEIWKRTGVWPGNAQEH